MMFNPMIKEHVRDAMATLPSIKQAFLNAVNDFAYQTTWPIESPLGEYARDKYNRDTLVDAVKISIRKMTVREGKQVCFERRQLIQAITNAGFAPDMLQQVEEVVEAQSIKMIDRLTGIKNGKQIFLANNGHHGRQYIAADVVEDMALHHL